MGLLDDAIREHLDLKRRRGADAEEVTRQEKEALGAPQRAEFAATEPAAAEPPVQDPDPEPVTEPESDDPVDEVAAVRYVPPDEAGEPEPPSEGEDDVLEETPEFLQETPEHDRLWFEQKPPRDFDLDR